ncbi:MAG: hypothetical protein KC616_23235 [Myxococcales bacterium]|nr:hypothetical protein [Myxococcales bacterium]
MRWHHLTVYEEKRTAAVQVAIWGYPRKLGDCEVRGSAWYWFRPYGLLWMHAAHGESPEDVWPHLVVAPEWRRHAPVRAIWTVLCALAQLHGAYRLRFERGEAFEGMEHYLRRLGWTEHGDGFVFELGE